MKLFKMMFVIVLFTMMLFGCSEDNTTEPETDGTLHFRMTTWNAEQSDRTNQNIVHSKTHGCQQYY